MGDKQDGNEADIPVDRLRSVFEERPIKVAVLFGSQATGEEHPGSDIDIAIELDGLEPGDDGFNDVFFDLVATLNIALDTEDIDVVDVHTLGPDIAAAVFDRGTLIHGDEDRLEELRTELTSERDDRSPRERFDDALRKIDEHLA